MSLKDFLHKHLAFLRKPERYTQLKEFQIFEGLNNRELNVLDALLYQREYSKGETLYEKGFPVELVYLILSGEVQLQETQQSFGAGQVFDLGSLFSSDKRPDTAIAVEDTEVLALSHSDFNDLINKNRGLGVKVLKNICIQLSHLTHDRPC
ncbi:MAG TPA: cyclic nucleotide-binding domain-containing protein [Candidatus Cloacimonadota bacterium]|mgnify:CR=1 FL=1|nr:cyclic nucleotide-binding domain-containing protein [Candidatus Cloacimonadota bacterium]